MNDIKAKEILDPIINSFWDECKKSDVTLSEAKCLKFMLSFLLDQEIAEKSSNIRLFGAGNVVDDTLNI